MSALEFTCPSCGSLLECDADKVGQESTCPHCSKPVVISDSNIVLPPPAPVINRVKIKRPEPARAFIIKRSAGAVMPCPFCGEQILAVAIKCKHCQSSLEETVIQAREPSEPKISDKSRGTYIILGLLLGGLGFHNFYAGYYKAGGWQLFLSIISMILMQFSSGTTFEDNPLGVVAWPILAGFLCLWILLDIFTQDTDADGKKFR